ncbi:MAG TPA: M36 family metallopeptidase, partial [Bryobacteraceae bacterium]|nr:M36 family metallopeptidase [Bryobacteraceae bacterium]
MRYRQQFASIPVINSDWVVNIDAQGQLLNAGGFLFTGPVGVAAPTVATAPRALEAAVRRINPSLVSSYLAASQDLDPKTRTIRFSRGGMGQEIEGRPVWFAVNGKLRPAWSFAVLGEDGVTFYDAVVDNESNDVLARFPLTLNFQSKPPAKGLVFLGSSPQPPQTPGKVDTTVRPIVERNAVSFDGDPVASPQGWVENIETIGNNTRTGANPLGTRVNRDVIPAVAPDRNFSFPLQLGPDAPSLTAYRDAIATNLFYWINFSHDAFYKLGFDEAAGNYQTNNFFRGGVEGDPMFAYVQFGSANFGAPAQIMNAFYSSPRFGEDGSPGELAMFLGSSDNFDVFTDSSLDTEVIVHEYTHGVSTRLVRQLRTMQGRAMGEGWSDFFALELTLPEGCDPDGLYPAGEYFTQAFGTGIRTRPYSTNLDINPLTYAAYGNVINFPEIHADGEIWVTALLDMRSNLIRQFGEREGRRRTRLLVIDGMKLSIPAPSYVDMRDAILLADRVDFRGASQQQIWAAFAKRGMGATAHSDNSDTPNVLASTQLPSNEGSIAFYETSYAANDFLRIVLHDANNKDATARVEFTSSSGDAETVELRREGEVFFGGIFTTTGNTLVNRGTLTVIPGDFISAYYTDQDTGSGAKLIQHTVPVNPSYSFGVGSGSTPIPAAQETAIFPNFATPTGNLTSIRTLPFSFPFFGKSYRSIWIFSDGLVAFQAPDSVLSACKDASSLKTFAGIAAMWTDLNVGGRAQSNENVYVTSGPKFYRIRWAAETAPRFAPPLGPTPDPVNFSLTLFEDGRIEMQYGSGNKNIVANDATARALGCSMTGPTVGIANGRDTYYLLSSLHNQRVNLENAPTLFIEPPFNNYSFPVAELESPAEGGTVRGVLNVKGFAYDPEQYLSDVYLLVDGVSRGPITVNTPRPEICTGDRAHAPECPLIGFNRNDALTSLGLQPGTHTVQLRVVNERGGFRDFPATPRSFTVAAGDSDSPIAGAVENPAV